MLSFFRKKRSETPPSPPDPALLAEMKALWFRYGGNGFDIWHDDLEAYRCFEDAHIPDETVEEWRQEMIQSEFSALTDGDPTRRWIVVHHLLALIGNTCTYTGEHYARLLDMLYEMADELDKRQRILILQRFADSNVPRNNGAIRSIHECGGLTPKMSDTLRRLADFTVSEADNSPDEVGWTDVPGRYRETLDDIRISYALHVTAP